MEADLEKQYERDLENFCDHGDIGDDWCGEEVIQAIITWIRNNVEFDEPILDIGCGNASLLMQLFNLGYTEVSGVDKSATAIQLAMEISKQECAAKVKLQVVGYIDGFFLFPYFESIEVANVLGEIPVKEEDSVLNSQYKLILDKGLFDSITTTSKDVESVRSVYLNNTHKLLKSDGILLVATCCHTEKELKRQFQNKGFNVFNVLPTPIFQFGGKKGHNVTVIAFRKKE